MPNTMRTVRLVIFFPKRDEYGRHVISEICEQEVKRRKGGEFRLSAFLQDRMFNALGDGYKVEFMEVPHS